MNGQTCVLTKKKNLAFIKIKYQNLSKFSQRLTLIQTNSVEILFY
jgi:hypothetical protein